MKVILLENVKRIGSIGEVIDVKRGFARNFLIANKKALYASKENIKEVEKIKAELQHKIITGDLKEIEAAATVIQLEAQGSWLQRSWRPIMMLLFAALMVAHWFGFTAPNIPESVQNSLLNIILVGIGGYTVGRSAEKVATNFAH